MLYTIAVILIILWLLGFSFHIAGGLIHLLLVIAVVVMVIQLVTGRRGDLTPGSPCGWPSREAAP